MDQDVDDPSVTERAAPANGWVLLLGASLFIGARSLFWLVHGRLFDVAVYETVAGGAWNVVEAVLPKIDDLIRLLVRLAGAGGVLFGVLGAAVATTSFRRGARWAWYSAWLVVLLPVIDAALFAGANALTEIGLVWDVVVATLALGGLVLSYDAFFGVEQPAPA